MKTRRDDLEVNYCDYAEMKIRLFQSEGNHVMYRKMSIHGNPIKNRGVGVDKTPSPLIKESICKKK